MIAHDFRWEPTSRRRAMRAVILLAEPYDLVGTLLGMAGSSPESWLFRDFLPILEQVVRGEQSAFEDGYNDLGVRGDAQESIIELFLTDPPPRCVVPTAELLDLVVRWREFLRAGPPRT